mmetsp:Transcript_18934/g.46896  ORF Transcript_18934/g.46896 Transcript_18934/m.46896 type:complete len:788 (-) Transcript_18934:651-3014(-)
MDKKNGHAHPEHRSRAHEYLECSSQEPSEMSALPESRSLPQTRSSRAKQNRTTTRSSLMSSDDEDRPMKAPTRTNSLRFQRQEEDRYEQLQMKNSAMVQSQEQSIDSSENGSVVGIIAEEFYGRNRGIMQKQALPMTEKNPLTNGKSMNNQNSTAMFDNKQIAVYQQLRDDERSQTSSTVPPPPVLQQQSHFSQPGAFRMSAGGRPRSNDLDSVANTVTSYPPHQQAPQAPVPNESEVDDECPTHPTPLNFATSMGTHVTAATAVTANPMSVVEAEPIDKHTLREFFDNGKVKFVICLLISFFLLLVMGAVYWLTGFNMNELSGSDDIVDATLAPTSPGDLDLNFFTRNALPENTRSALRKANSPQSKALAWLKNNTLLETYSLNRRLQRFALATFYFATGGDRRWKRNDGWLSDDSECNWFMTSTVDSFPCNEGVLMELSLREMNLVGKIPNELGLLSSLHVIELSRNQITGTIPTSLTGMYALQEIRFFDNYISGEIPISIESLEKLVVLDVAYNFLAGGVIDVGQLTNLRQLHLDRNLFIGELPVSIGQLSKLEILYLFGNAFEGTLDELSTSFDRMTSITHLGIDRNRLSGTLPPSLSLLTNLRSLTLGNNTFASTIPVELYKRCKDLEVLDVADNSLSGTLASEIQLLTNLHALFMEGNRLSGTLPGEVGNLQSLETLWLQENNFHGSIPSQVGRLPRLRDFKINDNILVDGSIPSEIGQLTNARRLAMENTRLTGTVPDTVCGLVDRGILPMYNLTVDCSLVDCKCCEMCLTSEIQNMGNR